MPLVRLRFGDESFTVLRFGVATSWTFGSRLWADSDKGAPRLKVCKRKTPPLDMAV